ncbi:MAG: metalloregulator ArsR/SmtB family transcription factor [Acidobacteriota bacterium]|nr:metalloregulator ArsR/SmtB family transcription factor [Acidobacteriota bacterium]
MEVVSESAGIDAMAAVIGEPARARMLAALMGGTALTATELAIEAEVTASTASFHLARLVDAELIAIRQQGRHRYYRLVDADVAEMLEGMMAIAARSANVKRPGTADETLRKARLCYDHLAGDLGVWLLDNLRAKRILIGHEPFRVSSDGRTFFADIGVDIDRLADLRRPLCRICLDWTVRRSHLAGSLGAAILDRVLKQRWARREPGSRALAFSVHGEGAFRAQFS